MEDAMRVECSGEPARSLVRRSSTRLCGRQDAILDRLTTPSPREWIWVAVSVAREAW
jgi:hypothetical protein